MRLGASPREGRRGMTCWRSAPSPLGPPGSRLVIAEIAGRRPFVWQFDAREIAAPDVLEAKLAWMVETAAAVEDVGPREPRSPVGAAR